MARPWSTGKVLKTNKEKCKYYRERSKQTSSHITLRLPRKLLDEIDFSKLENKTKFRSTECIRLIRIGLKMRELEELQQQWAKKRL